MATVGHLVLRGIHLLRWLTACLLSLIFSVLLVLWMSCHGLQQLVDSREFRVALLRDLGLNEKIKTVLRETLANLEPAGTSVLSSASPRATDAVRQALAEVSAELETEFETHLEATLHSAVDYLSARTYQAPDFGLHRAMNRASSRATKVIVDHLCEHEEQQTQHTEALMCTEEAKAAATRFTSWILRPDFVRVPQSALLGLLTFQVRALARGIRTAIHLLGWLVILSAMLFAVVSWRLRTLSALLSVGFLAVAAFLAPLFQLFEWSAARLLGPLSLSVATSVFHPHPFGLSIQWWFVGIGTVILGLRLWGPGWRARFWSRRTEHRIPFIRELAARLQCHPAGLRELEYLCYALLLPILPHPGRRHRRDRAEEKGHRVDGSH